MLGQQLAVDRLEVIKLRVGRNNQGSTFIGTIIGEQTLG